MRMNLKWFGRLFHDFAFQVDLSEGVDEASLQSLVNFMYSGELLVSESVVQDLMLSSSFLGMDHVLDFCADFLKVRLFLVADTQLYNWLSPSVGWLVGWSAG